MIARQFVGFLGLCILVPVGAVQASQAPSKGKYFAQAYAVSVNNQSSCLIKEGASFPLALTYKGLSGTIIEARIPIAPSLAGPMSVYTVDLTITSGSGTTNPSGTSAVSVSDSAATFSGTGAFSAKIYEVSKSTFMVDLTLGYQLSGGFSQCNVELDIGAVKN